MVPFPSLGGKAALLLEGGGVRRSVDGRPAGGRVSPLRHCPRIDGCRAPPTSPCIHSGRRWRRPLRSRGRRSKTGGAARPLLWGRGRCAETGGAARPLLWGRGCCAVAGGATHPLLGGGRAHLRSARRDVLIPTRPSPSRPRGGTFRPCAGSRTPPRAGSRRPSRGVVRRRERRVPARVLSRRAGRLPRGGWQPWLRSRAVGPAWARRTPRRALRRARSRASCASQ
jgi:hypothetical protein